MNTIRISKVHYEMLASIAKSNRIKPEALVETLIETMFSKKKK